MKKVTIILLAVFTMSVISFSFAGKTGEKVPKTVSISGTVSDKGSHEALAGALIRVEGTDLETFTDLDGKFSITGILPDTCKIKCSMISYSDREEEFQLDKVKKGIEINLESISTGNITE